MSERFGIPDHAPQHAPDHATQNPTAQGSWGQSGAADTAWSPSQAPVGGSGSVRYSPMSFGPTRKGVKTAILLALVLGPLGLFYVSFWNGILALFVVIPLARWLTFAVVGALGGRIELLTALIPILWCVTVPWAIIGTRRRNKRLGF